MMSSIEWISSNITMPTTKNITFDYDILNETKFNNDCDPFSNVTIDKNRPQEIVMLSLYLTTSIVALCGNLLVCKVIFSSRNLKNNKLLTTTYILIANLALSDILGALAIPTQWLFCSSYFLDSFYYGERMCATVKSLQIQSYYVSTFTMTVIAMDRYFIITKPLKKRMKPKVPIILVWLFSGAFTATTTFSMRVSEYFSPTKLIDCRVVLKVSVPISNFMFRKIRICLLILTQYLIPLTICAILYSLTVRTIWRRNVGEATPTQAIKMLNSKWKTIKMLIIVVVVFALSWLPVHIIHVMDFFGDSLKPSTCNSSLFYMFAYWLGISSCSFNPFIYWWFNPHFRKSTKAFVFCHFATRSRRGSKDSNGKTPVQRSKSVFYISSERQVSLLV